MFREAVCVLRDEENASVARRRGRDPAVQRVWDQVRVTFAGMYAQVTFYNLNEW